MSRFRPPLVLLLAVLIAGCTAAVTERSGHRPTDSHPAEAAAMFSLKRQGTEDRHRSYDAARDAMRSMPRYSTVEDVLRQPRERVASTAAAATRPLGRWRSLGPGNIGGRTRALIIDPVEPRIMYAAGVSGGIWKSLSGGGQWEPIGDNLTNVAVNSLAQSAFDRNVIYAGTGEGYLREEVRGTALPLRGDGIFVTRDAGETWTRLASTATSDFHWVNDLAVSAHDPRRLYAATRTGVWRSLDEGASWQRVLPVTVKGGCLDLAARPGTAGDYLFVSCGTFEQATVYRNVDAAAGSEWQAVLSEPYMGRTTLAIAPSDPTIVYALSASNEPGASRHQAMLAVWRSDADGDAGSWNAQVRNTSTTDPLAPLMLTNLYTVEKDVCLGIESHPTTMGWYCNVIAVDPVNPDRVWVGGVDLFRSDDGGRSWGLASYWWSDPGEEPPFVHADQHVILFHPQYDGASNTRVYFANDGGIFRTDSPNQFVPKGRDAICRERFSQVRFDALNNNYGVTQFYHGAVFPDGRGVIGGTQDNGSILSWLENGTEAWERVTGGDGAYVAVSQKNPDLIFTSAQYGFIFRSVTGGRTFRQFTTGLNDPRFLFIAPLALDPNDQTTLWTGGERMWRNGDDGGRWWRASEPMPAQISAIAIATGNSDLVLAGTISGHIARSAHGRTAREDSVWTSVRPREGFVSSLTFDPFDSNVAYATYAGFGGVHVWKSVDAGATWNALDGSGTSRLPDIPVHSLAIDPTRRERLYLGTDLGIFVSLDGGSSWAVEENGFGAVITEALVIGAGANGPAVYAFTHGRGAWRAELTVRESRRRTVR